MAVVIATSTNSKFTTFSSTNATLATALSEVLNELDTQNRSLTKTRFTSFFDDTGQEFTFVAICKN
jgi:hypothetical protein